MSSFENPFKKKVEAPEMSHQERVEKEKQELLSEIRDLRAHADDLEKNLDKIAESRAKRPESK